MAMVEEHWRNIKTGETGVFRYDPEIRARNEALWALAWPALKAAGFKLNPAADDADGIARWNAVVASTRPVITPASLEPAEGFGF